MYNIPMKIEKDLVMATEFTFDADIFSDLHKDAYGFRPRGHWFYEPECTDAERQEIWDSTLRALDARIEEDRQMEQRAIERFEAQIMTNMEIGAKDRATAIRWILQAEGHTQEYDMGYICYCLGLPYFKGYEEEFAPLMDEREAA